MVNCASLRFESSEEITKIYLPSTTGFSTFVSSFGAGRDSGWNEGKTRDVKCRKTVAEN
jgi:hypothetical protein